MSWKTEDYEIHEEFDKKTKLSHFLVITPDGREHKASIRASADRWIANDITEKDKKDAKEIEDAKPKKTDVQLAEERIKTQGEDTYLGGKEAYVPSYQAVGDSLTLSKAGLDKYTPIHLKKQQWEIDYGKKSDLGQAIFRLNNQDKFPFYTTQDAQADSNLVQTKTKDPAYITVARQKELDKEAQDAEDKSYGAFDINAAVASQTKYFTQISKYEDNPKYDTAVKAWRETLALLNRQIEAYREWAEKKESEGKRIFYK